MVNRYGRLGHGNEQRQPAPRLVEDLQVQQCRLYDCAATLWATTMRHSAHRHL
jgi:hypothetical protein